MFAFGFETGQGPNRRKCYVAPCQVGCSRGEIDSRSRVSTFSAGHLVRMLSHYAIHVITFRRTVRLFSLCAQFLLCYVLLF